MLEYRVKNLSDDQLEQYFAKNTYFKNALENTVSSVNSISSESRAGSWIKKVQSVYEDTYLKNLVKILIWPAPNVIIATVACIALLTAVAVPMAFFTVDDEKDDKDIEFPLANFSSNVSSGYSPFSVQFADLSQNATEWNWDFGDGTKSTERNPVHTYSSAGNYAVSMIVTNKKGMDSKTAAITVLEQIAMPVAHFSSNVTDGPVPLSVQFTDLSQNATGWNWDFGDGTNSSEQNPAHTYLSAQAYPVILRAHPKTQF